MTTVAPANSPADEAAYRLPRTVVPIHYDLTLTPNLREATFKGEAQIDIEVLEPVKAIVLNAAELIVGATYLLDANGQQLLGSPTLNVGDERLTIAFRQTIRPGRYQLHLRFDGILNSKLRGFYRSTFRDTNGVEEVIAVTQFESTDARRAFPCWDEPDFKATFAVTLIVEDGLTAISNGPIIGAMQVGDGKTAYRFGTSMKMSTYLVAFIVGPFQATEPVDVRGVPLRVVAPRGKLPLARFALDIGAFALRHFADYFGIPYPAEKLDLIAVPDFAFGAMENLGAVTFRETALLVDESKATKGDLERIADVVAHEIAHMWFGDLVTMRWWNGIWLNEAFATFMETACVDAWKPEWKRWDSFAVERTAAMGVDALQTTRPVEFVVRRPAEANDMFDVLTYEKGCSVLRMLEQYIEPAVFQAGISAYLKQHAYANTETSDLWDALEEASKAPVRDIMESWIFQAGFPLVTVERVEGGVKLSQRIFRYLGADDATDRLWQIPLLMRVETTEGVQTTKALLADRELFVPLPEFRRIVVNAGGSGFYRVRYSDELLGALRADLSSLSAVERYQLIDNTHAASVAGLVSVRSVLDVIVDVAATESDRNVWLAMISAMSYLHRAAPDTLRPALRAKYRTLLAPLAQRLGWDPAPGETVVERQFRATILNAYGVLAEDAAAQVTAKTRYRRYLDDPASLDPNLVPTVIDIIAHQGGPEDYDAFDARRKTATTPQDESRYLFALAAFPERTLLERTLAKTLTSDVRTQDAGALIALTLSNLHGGQIGWRFLKEHWEALQARLPFNAHARMVGGLAGVVDATIAADAQAFFAQHPPKEGAKQIAQTLERQRVIIAHRDRVARELPSVLDQ